MLQRGKCALHARKAGTVENESWCKLRRSSAPAGAKPVKSLGGETFWEMACRGK